ncbi:AMP-binding protein [Mycobacterium simiae]|uniref:AMP-binding protein n=1 Tax=Mycobacterium simiae TaxID=1784 RepID=A0A5B1BT57_MYCSI|nr:AMP-binding protein [Mycobacterium simiae]
MSRSQQNIYNGVLQDSDPTLYLIGKSYRFHPLELSRFLVALEATILKNPIQLCVLGAPARGTDYPNLLLQLKFGDVVRVRPDDPHQSTDSDKELTRMWSGSIFAKPLVRYTVRTDERGQVSGLDVFTHHILVDGGATGIIEADLARYLVAGKSAEIPCLSDGLAKLSEAHRREAIEVEKSLQRFAAVVQRELTDEARNGAHGTASSNVRGTATKAVLSESVTFCGQAFDSLMNLSEEKQVPLNVLVAAAAVAVDASLRQSTESLLVYAVDNRFGDPELDVATCLVNSVAHSVQFAPFASVQDVVRALDKSYVKAVRRRWLREEHYRRMFLAINRTSHIEALTLNFIRESCAPGLRPFLAETPVATAIGPVEGMTVACVLDEDQRALNLAIWNRADLPKHNPHPGVAERITATLESMVSLWDQPLAMSVNEWLRISPEGACCLGDAPTQSNQPRASAWFLDAPGGVSQILDRRCYAYQWVAWLAASGAVPGDVLVFADDGTDKTIDLLFACHVAGCGYSVCDSTEDVARRADSIAGHGGDVSVRVVNVSATRLPVVVDATLRQVVHERVEQVRQDDLLGAKTAYIMPTSGSTGRPKLVRISHGSLALFCAAVRHAYGWGTHDTILQCAPLTSDISVEEIFGGAACGSELVRSHAMRMGDLDALARDLVAHKPTILDLPTAVWHLLCEDGDALDAIRCSQLRQIVIGGETIRPRAVDKWIDSVAVPSISLISSYGPTEATVIVSYLPIVGDGATAAGAARLRLGRPLVPNTVFVAFGEVVIVGDLVAAGYLGVDAPSFGTVTTPDGSQRRAFATADRVTVDAEGFPVLSGRKDAIVKISGRRIDIAEVTSRISADPAISDIAVELHKIGLGNGLGVWFETQRTREGAEDTAAAARIRRILLRLRVSSFFVVGVPHIPRKPNGKVDSDNLQAMPHSVDAARSDAEAAEKAAGLAEIWSRQLGSEIRPDSSLLGRGIGSLDLIRILPDTRKYLDRHLTLLDLISADTAANLADAVPTVHGWMDVETTAEIESDVAVLWEQRPADASSVVQSKRDGDRPIVVLGASGILGTGFAQAILDLRRSGVLRPEVVLATRSELPERDPWAALRGVDGIRIEHLAGEVGSAQLDSLIRGAGTVVNCIGNTHVVVPYRELRLANLDLVSVIAKACASHGARMVHLSTFVVNADITMARVTDPRDAPYPYAASKSLAELIVVGSPLGLDFTIVRLPRVLGTTYQLRESTDILVSVVDACLGLRTYPSLTLTEEVTTGRAAAHAILGLLPELAGPAELGRGITVIRGEPVAYAEFLSEFACDAVDIAEWKHRLDRSDWAKQHPRRWSVIDAWVSLGMRLGNRSYADYLADYPTIDLGVEPVAELVATPQSLQALLRRGCSQPLKHAGN